MLRRLRCYTIKAITPPYIQEQIERRPYEHYAHETTTVLTADGRRNCPQELVEAARIDGCNFIQIYYRIFLPLSKPALATLGIFTFLGSWNNLMGPLIFLTKVETMTVTLGLTLLTNQTGGR